MLRIKLLAAVVSIVVAMVEEISWFEAESPAPKIELQPEEKLKEWPPLDEKATAAETAEAPEPTPTLTVSASIYHPEPGQTDSTPFITADGSRINKKNPAKHRWIAISRDLHSKWGGDIQFGDSLWITGISEDLDGMYVVRDVMNKRIKKQVDILVGQNDDVMGFWDDVQIAKLN
ncbi:RlpA-like double-psi beta-barrel domain-containing protein [Pontibacter akesuensis]|uniref:3D (Asp-Asp-Asp) domain-containing protein n=1 Tax=Pontibacter akesuensis TaxID=388950 RepID=A0A1I7KHQ6_9BACT|nr:hypothetical protein [Pontibacter akesuensis]GHA78938.1 hypothetical protein GCM10007389_36290 [Pontibacter akesuensis]SFU96967.1 hypothetical protein SAMN04487941_3759 [Pontibacter akesuensis]